MPFRPLAKKLVYYCKKKDVTKLFKCLKKSNNPNRTKKGFVANLKRGKNNDRKRAREK